MVYENYKVYGPYLNKKDNRLRCNLVFKNKMKIISYKSYMNIKEQILRRQEFNRDVLMHLKNKYGDQYKHLWQSISQCIEGMPQQRFAQIICNYILPDYRSSYPSEITKDFMEQVFPNNSDPFYEESYITLKRISQ